MDNGKFTIGAPTSGGPEPQEILHIIKTPDATWCSFKTGFGKYMGVDTNGQVVATAEAIGGREKWEIVFQEGKCAMQALGNSCFLSVDTDREGYVYAGSKKAKDFEMIKLRTKAERVISTDWRPSEDKLGLTDMEIAYRKKFQHSKIDLNPNSRSQIKKAKDDGDVHETLLDRRCKMKSDKYC